MYIENRINLKQETAKDSMAALQSNFQNLNAKVNQNVDIRRTDGQYHSVSWNRFAIQPMSPC